MSRKLQQLTAAIKLETADLELPSYIELLRELANWAENEAGLLEYSTPDAEDYDN